MGEKVLAVDDDPMVLELLETYLKNAGYEVELARSGAEALEKFRTWGPDLVILDIMMPPGMDGWDVCREIRKTSKVPVIMLSARGEELDKVLGLELGADDYVTKPFSPREVTARVKAVLRRSLPEDKNERDQDRLEFPHLSIDLKSREVRVGGRLVTLAPKEFDLLAFMARHPGQVFSREQLYDQIWGFNYYGGVRTVDVHITRLRSKLESDDDGQTYLTTVWGVGYKFECKNTAQKKREEA